VTTCNFRWDGPRKDVPTSATVEHVCALDTNHPEDHTCSCGASTLYDDAEIAISEDEIKVLESYAKGEITLEQLKEYPFITTTEDGKIGIRVRILNSGGPAGQAEAN